MAPAVVRMLPPSRRALVAVWVAAAALFGTLLAVAQAAEGPLDDADPAWQRPGFFDAGPLPTPAPALTDRLPAPGVATVVFFIPRAARLCRALGRHFDRAVGVVVVTAGGGGRCPGRVAVVPDPDGRLVRAYGLRRPRGDGRPVGYAVVDAGRRIRYRTLDPSLVDRLEEVTTMVDAVG